jgi:hypothetical protein
MIAPSGEQIEIALADQRAVVVEARCDVRFWESGHGATRPD